MICSECRRDPQRSKATMPSEHKIIVSYIFYCRMGNTATTPHDGDEFAEFDGIETLGYRVLGVQPSSPASKAGLVSFFDFLLGANEQMLLGSGEGLKEGDEYDDVDFPALLQANRGSVVELLVWNIKVGFDCDKQ